MYAQLFYRSEEGNVYPQTERLFIDDSLEGLLSIPEEHEGNDAFWEYFNQSERQSALSGGWHPVDNNNRTPKPWDDDDYEEECFNREAGYIE